MNSPSRRLAVPGWLFVLIAMTVVNSLVTGLHFLLIFLDVIPIKGKMAAVIEIATGDIIVSVVPSLCAAWGLWRRQMWGWALSFVVAGSYLHGQFVLLGRFYLQAQLGSMSMISVYFIVFYTLMAVLLWRHRDWFFSVGPHPAPRS